jgi:transglutaminase-like putative cysteine protease
LVDLVTVGIAGAATTLIAALRRHARAPYVVGYLCVIVLAINFGLGSHLRPTADWTIRLLTLMALGLELLVIAKRPSNAQLRACVALNAIVLGAAAVTMQTRREAVFVAVAWAILMSAAAVAQKAATGAESSGDITWSAPKHRSGRPSIFSVIAWPVCASLVVSGLLLVFLPAASGHVLALAAIGHSSRGTEPTRGQLGADTGTAGELDLTVRGQLGRTPLLQVSSSSPPLWAGAVYGIYTGQAWLTADAQRFQIKHGRHITLDHTMSATKTYAARLLDPRGYPVAWAPGPIVGVDSSALAVAEAKGSVRFIGLGPGGRYHVTVTPMSAGSASRRTLRSSDRVPPQGSQWLQLPAEVPSRVMALAASITKGARTTTNKITAIVNYLRTHERYSVNSPVPGANQDAVDDFLFRDHVGFCEQFASAEAILLRSVGVPSRLVSGLAYGTNSGSTRVYRESDAHAWVEALVPGEGWVVSDPTKGAALADLVQPRRLARAAAIWIALLALLAGGWFGWRRIRHSRIRRAPRTAGSRASVLTAAFHVYESTGPPRLPHSTVFEYVAARGDGIRLAVPVALLERDRYSPQTISESDTGFAVNAFSAGSAHKDPGPLRGARRSDAGPHTNNTAEPTQ